MTVIPHTLESNTVCKIVFLITRASVSRNRVHTPNSTIQLARAHKPVEKSLAI
jgi:hypothetical protein